MIRIETQNAESGLARISKAVKVYEKMPILQYAALASQAAYTANKDIAEYILLSIKKNLSYEGLERLWQLREIERMACCRTDFYGYRRYFYHLFDLELRRIGK